MKAHVHGAGIDVGSTTAKLCITDEQGRTVFTLYRRHSAEIGHTLSSMFARARAELGDPVVQLAVTGSAAMGLAERSAVPFVQEVVAAGEVTRRYFPDVQVLIDIGGEDSKMIFFSPNRPPDIRMNGSCAGGTGAFIDQMAALLDLSLEELNTLAGQSKRLYPIASRCGVFAKTDVQNLVSRNIDLGDICASILQAVVVQNINTLARGGRIKPLVLLCGGPLNFLSSLRERFAQSMGLKAEQCLLPDQGLFLPAWGAALHETETHTSQPLSTWASQLLAPAAQKSETVSSRRLAPLFSDPDDFSCWQSRREVLQIPQVSYQDAREPLFLGIDSGSTTTKVMVIDQNEQMVFGDYRNNRGKPVESVLEALQQFRETISHSGRTLPIAGGAVTGYGEDLIRAALDLDMGVVETLAHWRAAAQCDPQVSFIIDIGGQDMKAIFIQDQGISRIEINEACSSGCGSFIEGFAQSLGLTAQSFAQQACTSEAPCDLGTRCTVFMNSRIKQAQREEAPLPDIAAGLAYAVIKNSLYKVLKLRDPSQLGAHIVVQGGTFRNPAVHKALEELTGCNITSSDRPEMMGALGAALLAKEAAQRPGASMRPVNLDLIAIKDRYSTRQIQCRGCTNQCAVTVFEFDGNRKYHVGNKCERIFTNQGGVQVRGENLFTQKNALLFAAARQPVDPPGTKLRIGIPRILEIYESFPFWHALLTQCGMEVVLSDESNQSICDKGLGTVMSDNICFPAKLAHGHVVDLIEKDVDRIFYPHVVHEPIQDHGAANSYNCPIVSGYADVLKGAMGLGEPGEMVLDAPPMSFRDEALLKKAVYRYLKTLKVPRRRFNQAFSSAQKAQRRYHEELLNKGRRLLARAETNNTPVIVLAGRPYHSDPFIEHQTSEIIADLGSVVLPVEVAAGLYEGNLQELTTVPQWAFPNRLLKAAQWVARQEDNRIQYVLLNSFGCGPDAFIMDEIRDLLAAAGKTFTLIKIDDISSTGSVRLRLRSLVEALQWRPVSAGKNTGPRQYSQVYHHKDRAKTIIAPYFADCYSPFFPPIFKLIGHDVRILPPADTLSAEYGLTYANNEICYPATLVIGDIVKAFKSGGYDPDRCVAAMSQTGGQCRASSYVALIKKALISAGYPQVPVVALTQDEAISNDQPGFNFDMARILKPAFCALLYADAISRLYHRSIVRERRPGQALALRDLFLQRGTGLIDGDPGEKLIGLLKEAVSEFNQAIYPDVHLPRIGIVGEIYLKFNRFSQFQVTDWIISQGVEAVVPSLLDFIIQIFVNQKVNQRNHIEPKSLSFLKQLLLERQAGKWIGRFDRIMQGFQYYEPAAGIYHKAKSAGAIINLVSQFGEGWLIPGEIACYAQEGISDVVCLQPFGCTSNHVIAKGIERKLKRIYPGLNLLFLDFDAGTSEVNVLNRLHFMVSTAKAQPQPAAYGHG